MPRFDVELHILVDAPSAENAFATVRSHYAVINDPEGKVCDKELLVDMFVNTTVDTVDDDQTVDDYA